MAKNANMPKRHHHVLPKLYLKGFVIEKDEPFIWVYKRGESYNPGDGKLSNNPYRGSINKAGAEKDFYADPKGGGVKDFETFENILESREKPANSILQKLRTHQTITNEEKYLFSQYIILTHKRVWSGRERVREILPEHAAAYEPSIELFQKLKWPDIAETRAYLRQVSVRVIQKEGFDIQAHNRITATAPDSFLVEVLHQMRWSFYIASEPHAFLTGDNPVFISEQFGLGKNISELSFPISTDTALVASWNRSVKEGFSEAKPQLVKELNRRTISMALQQLYCFKNLKWVVLILNKKLYEYHPIYSTKSVIDVAMLVIDGPGAKPRLVWT